MTTTPSSKTAKSSFEKARAFNSESAEHFGESQLRESFHSIKIKDALQGRNQFQSCNTQKDALKYPSDRRKQEPTLIQDQGLTCLLSQLGRINDQIQYNNSLKKVLVDYEEENTRDLAASLAKSLVAPAKPDGENASKLSKWTKYYDNEAGAEYFFNHETGVASWLDPDAV